LIPEVSSPDTLFFQNSLSMQVADIDFFAAFDTGRISGDFALGLRYANISHSYTAARINPAGSNPNVQNVQVSFLTSLLPTFGGYNPFPTQGTAFFSDVTDFLVLYYSQEYKGFGPTASFHFEFPSDSLVQLYMNTKGGVELGSRTERTFVNGNQTGTFTGGGGTPIESFQSLTNVAVSHTSFAAVPFAEIEAGVSAQTSWSGFRAQLKVGGVAQFWGNAGNSTDPTSSIFLYGVNVSLGFAF
jgi:hypothetical protein